MVLGEKEDEHRYVGILCISLGSFFLDLACPIPLTLESVVSLQPGCWLFWAYICIFFHCFMVLHRDVFLSNSLICTVLAPRLSTVSAHLQSGAF